MNTKELKSALAQCYGTERWYTHPLNSNMTYTDGVKIFADNAGGGAHWFLDIVATELMILHKTNEFLCITLVTASGLATIVASDSDDNVLYTKDIDFTDCPAGDWLFYLTNNVMLLPSEF